MNGLWPRRRVLVTGCTGLLGSWLTDALVRRGAQVTGLVRDGVPRSNLYLMGTDARIQIVRGSVEDYFLLERTLNEYEIDTVFHLAAQTLVTIANRGPLSTFRSNIEGTWNILEACRRVPGVSCIVVASSDKAYGDQDVLPYTEETPLAGRHPYDVSKSCADLIAQAYHTTYRLPLCVTRLGNLYGGGDLNFNRLVPGTIWSVLRGERPIIRSDGSNRRAYIYVLDAVDAYLALAERMISDGLTGEALNFGGEPHTVLDMARTIIQMLDRRDLEPVVLGEATGEIHDQVLADDKARGLLGWRPRFGSQAGLEETIAWYRAFAGSPAAAGLPRA